MDHDPRASFEVSRAGLQLARRFGHRLGVSMLIVNASSGAMETGEWAWARAEIRAGLDEVVSDEERINLLAFLAPLRVEGGATADPEVEEVERWLTAHVEEQSFLASSASGMRSARALQRGDLAAASSGYLEGGGLDPYNAVPSFADATLLALLARDRGRAMASLEALRATGSHAAIARLVTGVGEAGIAALDGQAGAARAGLLAGYAGLRDVGAARRQALTGLVMATLLGSGDAQVRAAIAESRGLFERMGAGLWLALLDSAETGWATAPGASPATPPAALNPAVHSAVHSAVPAEPR